MSDAFYYTKIEKCVILTQCSTLADFPQLNIVLSKEESALNFF